MDLLPKEYKQRVESQNESVGAKLGAGALLARFKSGLASVSEDNFRKNFLRSGIISGLLLLILFLLFWAGLGFYQKSLESQTEKAKQDYAGIFGNNERDLAVKAVDMEKRMGLVQDVLKSHVYSSEFFNRLSAVTLPQVQWTTCEFSAKETIVTLKGRATNYAVLAKQILAFQESDSGFFGVKISGIALDKVGGVGFSAALNIDPKILQK